MAPGGHLLEAARAAALAAHSSAGHAATAGRRSAARLLRSAEALARAAVADLQAGDRAAAGTPLVAPQRAAPDSAVVAPTARKKRSSRKKSKKDTQKDAVMTRVEEARITRPPDVAPAVPVVALAPSPTTAPHGRVLAARPSRERSPHRKSGVVSHASSTTGASTGVSRPVPFSTGQVVVLRDLVSRPDLAGCRAKVLSFDSAAGRYAVCVDQSGEKLRVREANIHFPGDVS